MQTNLPRETDFVDAGMEKLEECLQRELSAVETYDLVLKNVTHVAVHQALQEILTNHARRVERLREKLGRLGVDAPKSSGVWGALAKAVQAGADLFGDRTAIAALEAGEDRGLKFYTEDLADCDSKTRRFIEIELLPEQQRTHDLCRNLKRYLNEPS